MTEKIITVDNFESMLTLFGSYDENINLIQKEFNVVILNRGSDIRVSGEEKNVKLAKDTIETLIVMMKKGEGLTKQNIRYVFSLTKEGEQQKIHSLTKDGICVTTSGRIVKPKTLGQKNYVDSIKNNTIVIGVGPAGTGKTYLAVAMAVKAFKAHDVNKIILTRPAVEAGEKLGFLPGDLQNKVDPYLRPLYDALF
ncbi:MAG: ATP-binding protein, partial [Clostridiales bacterium]|nr:ATP-binding protein [Clostridiales bacterium]